MCQNMKLVQPLNCLYFYISYKSFDAILKQKAVLSLHTWHCLQKLKKSCDNARETCTKNEVFLLNEDLNVATDSLTKCLPFWLFTVFWMNPFLLWGCSLEHGTLQLSPIQVPSWRSKLMTSDQNTILHRWKKFYWRQWKILPASDETYL